MAIRHVLPSSGQSQHLPDWEGADPIDRTLRALRDHLGMDAAFVSRVSNRIIVKHSDPDRSTLFDAPGNGVSEAAFCRQVLDGRPPHFLPHAAAALQPRRLDDQRKTAVGECLSIPLRLSDGRNLGTFCCRSRHREPLLRRRDVEVMEAFAAMTAEQIESDSRFTDEHEESRARLGTIIERQHVTMALQPIYRLADLQIVGFEALARFPDGHDRAANQWFEEAHAVGLGPELEATAIRSALRALPYLPPDLYLAVNVSPTTLVHPVFAQLLPLVPEGRVVFEITEHAAEDWPLALKGIEGLRSRAKIAIDDAGAGYSGLSRILEMRPDLIKLDMALTRNIDRDTARSALATALVAFGREISCPIIAEGVETAEEYAMLRKLGVTAAQGNFLQPPMPVAAAIQFLGFGGSA